MNLHVWTFSRITSAVLLLASFAYAQGSSQEGKGYVRRSEYEALKKEVEALKRQPQNATAARAPQHGWSIDRFKPRYEIVRADGWMEPGKLDEANVSIAHLEDVDLYMMLDTVGRFQYFQQKNVVQGGEPVHGSLEPGFQTAFGNLGFLGELNKNVELYFDILLADKPHEDQLQGDEGYIRMALG